MENIFARLNSASRLEKYWLWYSNRCGLLNCSGSKSLWRRFRARRHGIQFDDVHYCRPQCLEIALRQSLLRVRNQTSSLPPVNRMPLGLLMVARGKLTYEQVAAALSAQKNSGSGSIGEWFEKLGFLTEQEVTGALALQWGCPVSSSLEFEASGQKLPVAILENFLMWPLHYVSATNTQYVAFGKRVDHTALYAIEKMLGCRVQACVAPGKVIGKLIGRLRQESRPGEVEFHSINDSAEIIRIALSYIARLGAEQVRMSRVGDFIWLLLKNAQTTTQLLFRLEAGTRPALLLRDSLSAETSSAISPETPLVWKNKHAPAFSPALR